MRDYEKHDSYIYLPYTDNSNTSQTGGTGMSTAIGSLIDGLFGLVGTGINNYQQDKTNRENREYATQMTTAQWERDDSSLQRQVQDAQLAGLSPLAVTGAMNSSSPLNYVAQAPQMDLSSLIGLASSAGSQIEAEKFQASENEKDRIATDLREMNKLNAQIEQWNKENELTESEQIDSMSQFNKTMLYQYDVLNSQNSNFFAGENLKRLQYISEQSLEQYRQVCNSIGVTPKTKTYDNYESYTEALNKFWIDYADLALARGDSNYSDVTSYSNSSQDGMGSNVAGVAGVNFSESSAESMSVDMTKTHSYEYLSKYLSRVYFPIYVLDSDDSEHTSYKYVNASHYKNK